MFREAEFQGTAGELDQHVTDLEEHGAHSINVSFAEGAAIYVAGIAS